jgi:nucleoside-diphosphate-sugar epimerase
MRVALTGATGTIGEFCLRLGAARGWQQRLLLRSGALRPALAQRAGLEPVAGQLEDSDFTDLLAGCDALVHAAFAHAPGRYRGGEGDDPRGFWQLNLGATIGLLEQARAAGVKRVVLFSSRAVFGPHQIGRLSEAAVPEPDTHYGLQKWTIEGLARLYSRAPEAFAVACLRPTGVYGTRLDPAASKWAELARQVAQGVWPTGNRQASEVHGGDLAEAVALLLTCPVEAMAGQVFHASDLVISRQRLAALMGQVLGRGPQGHDRQEVPPALEPMTGPVLATDKLEALGWQPRGQEGLTRDLQDLLTGLEVHLD